jgi:bifunctional DNA-binding transcriptional regulator/antitoxin component of YhaV-PrlF toxin-antitoxin module
VAQVSSSSSPAIPDKDLDLVVETCKIPIMSTTLVREQRQVTLPPDVFEAAGLKIDDPVEWRFEGGEIRGRKLGSQESREAFPPGSLLPYLTPERDQEIAEILAGCVHEPE